MFKFSSCEKKLIITGLSRFGDLLVSLYSEYGYAYISYIEVPNYKRY